MISNRKLRRLMRDVAEIKRCMPRPIYIGDPLVKLSDIPSFDPPVQGWAS